MNLRALEEWLRNVVSLKRSCNTREHIILGRYTNHHALEQILPGLGNSVDSALHENGCIRGHMRGEPLSEEVYRIDLNSYYRSPNEH